MPKYSQILLLVLCTFLLVQNRLFAVEVTDLYVAHVPISSKAEGEKTLALKKAMKAVILKVAGQSNSQMKLDVQGGNILELIPLVYLRHYL